jgi:hypothetical protein
MIQGKSPKVRKAIMARMIEIGAAVEADGYVAATEAGLRAAGTRWRSCGRPSSRRRSGGPTA